MKVASNTKLTEPDKNLPEQQEALTPKEAKNSLYEAQMLMDELQRRHKEDKLKYYKPHPKQETFHRCCKRNRWALGGNRTGKTEVGAVEAVWYARGNHPYKDIDRPMSGWVVSLTNEVQRDVAQQKILSYLNPKWIKGIKMREGRSDDYENGVIDFILVESIHGGLSKGIQPANELDMAQAAGRAG